jgi:hypothetical protein
MSGEVEQAVIVTGRLAKAHRNVGPTHTAPASQQLGVPAVLLAQDDHVAWASQGQQDLLNQLPR